MFLWWIRIQFTSFLHVYHAHTYIESWKTTAKKCRKLSKREIIKLWKTVLTSLYIHLSSRLMQWNTVNKALFCYGKLILVELVIYQRNVDIRRMNNFKGSKINTGSGTSTATHSATGVNITSSCQVGEARQRSLAA